MCDLSENVKMLLEQDLSTLETMVLEIGRTDDRSYTVGVLIAYMIKRGLVFYKDISCDKDPRGILNGRTSVRYQRSTKISEDYNVIILYCHKDEIDKRNIEKSMGKIFFDNKGDKTRPYGFVFKPEEFPHAVSILLENSKNIQKN